MMAGQLVAIEHAWPMQVSRPVLNLHRRRRPLPAAPATELLSRLAVGAGVGGVIGLATLHPVFWLVLGATAAYACGLLRDRVH
jgi:hypothetical protein